MAEVGTATAKIAADMTSFNRGMKQVESSLDRASNKMKKVGSSMRSIGKKMSLGISLPILGIGVAIGKTAAEFEAGLNLLEAKAQASTSELESMRKKALELGASTRYSSKEVVEAMTEMAGAGTEVNDILATTGTILNFATANSIELGRAADVATDTMQQFGLGVQDTARVVDVITEAVQGTSLKFDEYTNSMKFAAPIAKSLGLSIEQTTAAIALMSEGGVKGTMAGTAMRSMLVSLAKPTKEATKTLQDLGIQTRLASGKMRQPLEILKDLVKHTDDVEVLATLFGREALTGVQVFLGQFEKFGGLTKTLEESAGASSRFAKILNTGVLAALKDLKSAWAAVQLSISENTGMQDAAERWITALANVLREFTKLDPQIQKTTAFIALFAAGIGPALLTLGLMAQGVGPAIQILAGLRLAVLGIVTALASPWLLAILGAIAALVIFRKPIWDFIKKTFPKFAETMEIVGSVVGVFAKNVLARFKDLLQGKISVKEFLSAVWEEFKFTTKVIFNLVNTRWPIIGETITNVLNTVKSWVETAWPIVKTAVIGVISGIVAWVTTNWTKIEDHIIDALLAAKNWIVANWPAIKESVLNTLIAVEDWIISTWVTVSSLITDGLSTAKEWIVTNWPAIKEVILGSLVAAKDWISSTWSTVSSLVTSGLSTAKEWLDANWPAIKDTIINALSTSKEWINSNWPAIKETIIAVLSTAKTWIVNSWSVVGGLIISALSGAKAWVDDNWETIQTVITTVMGAIKTVISTVMSTIVDIFTKDFEGSKTSLLTSFDEIRTKWNTVWSTVQAIIKAAWDFIKPIVTEISSYFIQEFSVITDWAEENWPLMQKTAETVMGAIGLLFQSIATKLSEVGKDLSRNWDAIGEGCSVALENIKIIIDGALKIVLGFFTLTMATINGDWVLAWNTLGVIVATTWEVIKSTVGNSLGFLVTLVTEKLGTEMSKIWNDTWQGFLDTVAYQMGDTEITVKESINAIIGLINHLIRAWNSIRLRTPEFRIAGITVPARDFGVTPMSEIPTLAEGGIVRKPTLAMIGEGGAEAVVPLGRGGLAPVMITVNGNIYGINDLEDVIITAINRAQRRGRN